MRSVKCHLCIAGWFLSVFVLPHFYFSLGWEIRGRRGISAMCPSVGKPSARRPCCEPMFACTRASALSSATGYSVESGSHAVMSCNGMPGHIQVDYSIPVSAFFCTPTLYCPINRNEIVTVLWKLLYSPCVSHP